MRKRYLLFSDKGMSDSVMSETNYSGSFKSLDSAIEKAESFKTSYPPGFQSAEIYLFDESSIKLVAETSNLTEGGDEFRPGWRR